MARDDETTRRWLDLRIVLIGQAAFGEKVLEALLNRGEDVAAVFCPPDPPGKPGGMRLLAESRGVPVHQPKRMRNAEVLEAFRQLRPDLNVMAFVTDIVPPPILEMPSLGTIQYHPSLLPRYRGGSAINWAIIRGETTTGLSIFWPDQGIDTGPILLQKVVQIGSDDTTGSLYFGRLFPLGVDAMIEAVGLVKSGTAPRLAQDESQATWDPLCTEDRAIIDWAMPVARVYDLIRGANPAPGASTIFRGGRLKISDARRVETGAEGVAGQVLSVEPDGFVVAGAGGGILVKRVQAAGATKTMAPEFVLSSGLRVGDILGS
jgi:methionyl-tRNA formyltransferase